MNGKSVSLLVRCWLILVPLSLAGCQQPVDGEKAVYPIQVKVLVDGQPQAELQVQLHDVAGLDQQQPTLPSGFTAADGQLTISTYAQGDGAPAGTYQVSVLWGTLNPISMRYGGPDKLRGRYSDAAQSGITWTITKGVNDLGTLELSTQ